MLKIITKVILSTIKTDFCSADSSNNIMIKNRPDNIAKKLIPNQIVSGLLYFKTKNIITHIIVMDATITLSINIYTPFSINISFKVYHCIFANKCQNFC